MTASITDAFSTVEIEAAAAVALACIPVLAALTVLDMADATFFPTSPMAEITVEVASSTSSMKSIALPIPAPTSSLKTSAKFFAWPPTLSITPFTLFSWLANDLYDVVRLLRAVSTPCSAFLLRVSALVSRFVAFVTFSTACAYSSVSFDVLPS